MSDNESMLTSRLSNKYTHLRKHSDGRPIMIANHLTITLSYNVMDIMHET